MILGLDIARSTGWCVGAPESRPTYGTYHLPKGVKRQSGTYLRWLDSLIREHGVQTVFFEQPVQTRRNDSFQKMRLLFGLCQIAEAAAEINEARVFEVPIGTWRKHFLGKWGKKREDAKRAALTRCKQLGYRPDSDDCAEAIGIWDYGASLISAQHGWKSTPLSASTRGRAT